MEEALASLNNLLSLKSVSQEGKSEIQMEFKLGTDMDFVMQEVRERLDYLAPKFPEDTRKPQIVKYDPNASPVLAVSLFGSFDEVALRETAENVLQKNLSRVPGVANIEVIGGQHLEILIEPDLEQLRASDLSILGLTTLLKQNNLELSLGSLSRGQFSLPLRSTGEFRDLERCQETRHQADPRGINSASGAIGPGQICQPAGCRHQPLPGGAPGHAEHLPGVRFPHRHREQRPAPGAGTLADNPALRF